ncbi:Aquaporin TIP3-1, partial [Linum perenne]
MSFEDLTHDGHAIPNEDLNNHHNSMDACAKKSSKQDFMCKIGAHELFTKRMWRAALAEMVGSACLLFALTTTVISCVQSTPPNLILIPVFVFVSAFPLLMATIPISGGHMNPVFTFSAALNGSVSTVRAFTYMVAQFLGSLIAFAIVKGTMDDVSVHKFNLGGCFIDAKGNGSGVSAGTALVVEFMCTFLVLYVAGGVAFDEERFKEFGLTTVAVLLSAVYGLAIYSSVTVTGRSGYGGVGLNPARCFGSALLVGGPLWNAHWVFWLGPFLACIVHHLFSVALREDVVVKKEDNQHEQ